MTGMRKRVLTKGVPVKKVPEAFSVVSFFPALLFILSLSIVSLFVVPTAVAEESIRVGILLPLTGRLAALGGQMERHSFLMAADAINRAGGIGGRELHLIIEDTEGRVSKGRTLVEKLISEDQVAVLSGGFSSSVTWSAAVIAEESKVPFLVNTASADRITEGWRQWIFRLNTPVTEQMDAFASFIQDAGDIRTAGICHEETPFGRFRSDKFKKQCRETGLALVGTDTFVPGAKEFISYFRALKTQSPDILYLVAGEEKAAVWMRQIRDVDLNPKLILGTSPGFTSAKFLERAGDTAEYVCSQMLWAPNLPYPGAQEYFDRYSALYGTPPDYHGAQAYAAVQVMAHALGRAGSLSRDGIRAALRDTRMMTVIGMVRFRNYENKRNQNRLPSYLAQWIGGRLEIVWPPKAATATRIYPTPPWDQR